MTAKFKVLPKTCDLLEFATFSWWDNKSGPRYRYVWCCHAKQGNVDIVDPPSDFQLRLLTQLTLKSEAVRDPNCCDIDCNVYNLPEVGISGHEKDLMSVSYMFSGRCKSKVGRTIYSLNLVMALQHQQWVNRWRDILDAVVKRRLMLFRILLHKDFDRPIGEARSTIEEDLDSTVREAVDTLIELQATFLDVSSVKIGDTYFGSTGDRRKRLVPVIHAMMLMYNRAIIVGRSPEDQPRVEKWVKTLSLLLEQEDRYKVFTAKENQPLSQIIPNAMVQGLIVKSLVSRPTCLRPVYQSRYPAMICQISGSEMIIYLTARTLWEHNSRCDQLEAELCSKLWRDDRVDAGKVLDNLNFACGRFMAEKRSETIVTNMMNEMYQLSVESRPDYLDNYLAYLQKCAQAVIHSLLSSASPRKPMMDEEFVRNQFFAHQPHDAELLLCLAETLHTAQIEKEALYGLRMYGLLLEACYYYIRTIFGDEILNEIKAKANVNYSGFSTYKVYSETVMPRLARAAAEVTDMPMDELLESFGVSFVSYVSRYGYDRILKVLGRNPRDFLSNLDNLHDYLRFSYHKIKPPSFFVTDDTETGCTLHYRSRRKGFKNYVIGQVRQVGKEFYNTDIKVDVIKYEETSSMSSCQFRLTFDNAEWFEHNAPQQTVAKMDKWIEITPEMFFTLFPFHLVLNRDMVILSVGKALNSVLPHLQGSQIDDLFYLERPMIDFHWEAITMHTNNVFELQSVDCIDNRYEDADPDTSVTSDDHSSSDRSSARTLTLRGQMLFMDAWDALLFLGTPVMQDLDHMFRLGLYINDLSIHDSSRELLLAGTQQSAELKLLLDQEQTKSKTLEESMRKLDEEMKKTDQLLYQMIPKSVANRLRKGEPALNTCEVFDSCTVLFSDVVGFTSICSAISPMQVVTMLNGMYIAFDTIIEKHKCYKVETIGDAYMVVGGVPMKSDRHAVEVAEMAFAMLNCMKSLKDPSDKTGRRHLELRIGVHSGMVVAGVVGLKMPRYCLFGDTVNTASRMETHSEPMKIHCSESTKLMLSNQPQYTPVERGSVDIKGKGQMKSYWLEHTDKSKAVHNNNHPTLIKVT